MGPKTNIICTEELLVAHTPSRPRPADAYVPAQAHTHAPTHILSLQRRMIVDRAKQTTAAVFSWNVRSVKPPSRPPRPPRPHHNTLLSRCVEQKEAQSSRHDAVRDTANVVGEHGVSRPGNSRSNRLHSPARRSRGRVFDKSWADLSRSASIAHAASG